jgi:Holliday junction resolvase RusA-like endonuclease
MKIVLYVAPRTKKNNGQIIFNGGRRMIIPSKAYTKFEKECLMQITGKYKLKINAPVNIKAIFYMDARRKVDLTNLLEAVDDMLVKAEILADDNRNIVAGHDGSRVYYDKENPRIELDIENMEDYRQW